MVPSHFRSSLFPVVDRDWPLFLNSLAREAARLINEQKATVIVEHLTYDALEDRFDSAIFTENQTAQDFSKAGSKLKKHVYD